MELILEPTALSEEEKLVAELELLDVRYLSRQTAYQPEDVRPPEKLFADLVRQPSARVRAGVIAVLLAHPELAAQVEDALKPLAPAQQTLLSFYYLAAFLLQQLFADRLYEHLGSRWRWIPEQFAQQFNLQDGAAPRENLFELCVEYQRLSHSVVNWNGTVIDVALRLLRRWDLELKCNR
jgi:hypothetical protein